MATCKQCGAVIHSYTYSGDFCTHTCALSYAVVALTGERLDPATGRCVMIDDNNDVHFVNERGGTVLTLHRIAGRDKVYLMSPHMESSSMSAEESGAIARWLDGRACKQCGYTYDCAAIHASHSRVTDDEIRLYSVSAACGHVGEMVCAIALGRKVEGVLGHLSPSAARALVELEIERLRAQGSM